MDPLTALLMATPIFGFTLTLDATPPASFVAGLPPLQIEEDEEQEEEADEEEADEEEADEEEADEEEAAGDDGGGSGDPGEFAELMEQRANVIRLHRPFGIATWSAMTVTVGLGLIQWMNKYGFRGQNGNRCAEGDAIFGRGQCVGQPVLHLTSAAVTTALYGVTFGLSFAMPDPGDLSEGDSDYARTLRRHKRLRWVHFAGMLTQVLLGVIVANEERFGLDRANDYGTLQILSTIHLLAGFATYATLTWAGAIMLF
jgi:hypothetical protein